jgi:hypothetical protein
MAQQRVEIYDETGLIEVKYIDVPDEPTIDEQIAENEAKLIEIYDEIQRLKALQNQQP